MRFSDENSADDSRIESWKEIATFFGRDQRTVKRWEKTRNLPIHRLPGAKSGVFAYSRELTAWLHSAPRENVVEADEPLADENDFLEIPAENEFDDEEFELEEPVIAPSPLPAGEMLPQRAPAKLRVLWVIPAVALAAGVMVSLYHFTPAQPLKKTGATGVSAHSKAPPSPAEEPYLQGRYYWSHRTNGALRQAVDSFTQAVIRDPNYAPAYAGLAESYDLMPQYTSMPKSQAFPMAIAAARKAVALDDSLAGAHRALAFALFYGDWNVNQAFHEYQRAIELDPNNAEVHSWYATSLLLLAHVPEARAEIEKARELDPTSRAVLANEALILYTTGERDESIAKLKDLENAEPDYLGPSGYLENIYLIQKDYPAYIDQLKRSASITKDPDRIAIANAAEKGWRSGGERGMWEQMATVYRQAVQNGRSSSFDLARAYAYLGRKQEADRYLHQAFLAYDYAEIGLLNGDLDPQMQGDPAFEKLKQQIRARVGTFATPIL